MTGLVPRRLAPLLRVLGGFVIGWLGLDIAFTFASAQEGLVSPTAAKPWVTVLGVAMLAMRMAIVFVVPPLATYAIVSEVFSRLARRASPPVDE